MISPSKPVAGTLGAWRAFFAGDNVAARLAASALAPTASREGRGRLAVELCVIEALAVCAADDLTVANALARRALLRAQAEAIPAPERMAALALARVRRRLGRPHLAMHVLGALSAVGANHFGQWLDWELLLAGGETLLPCASTGPAEAGRRLLAGARAGDRRTFDDAAGDLRRATRGIADGTREAEALITLLDIQTSPQQELVARWRAGDTAQTPFGLDGLGVAAASQGPSDLLPTHGHLAVVIARPGAPGVRALRPGVALAGASPLEERADSDASGVRTDMALAALALAGPDGLPRDDFFARVYGFAFVPRRHQAVLDMLVHRMRARVGTRGELCRGGDGGALALVLHERLAIPDPRCLIGPADRVSWAIGRLGSGSAQEAADALRMPLRAVQNVIRQLIEDGVCGQQRSGRQIRYHLAETTFTSLASALAIGK